MLTFLFSIYYFIQEYALYEVGVCGCRNHVTIDKRLIAPSKVPPLRLRSVQNGIFKLVIDLLQILLQWVSDFR